MINENIKYIARFVIETNTPMAIGSGDKGLTVDRLIARDANGLPYIPGTSFAGVVRHELDGNNIVTDKIFGFQDKKSGQGSRINFSSAILLADDGKTVLESLHNLDFSKGYYSYFKRLPERDHVRITHKGTADTEGHGKFDEELVHKGIRFVFEIELEGTNEDEKHWEAILDILHKKSFRIGAGTRKGFGLFNVIECKTKTIDLKSEISEYLKINSSLNKDVTNWKPYKIEEQNNDSKYDHYEVKLQPEDFYIFGAGIGDEDVDMTPKIEKYFDWKSGKPKLSENNILIPATSVKGALSHRVAYYYNTEMGFSIEKNLVDFSNLDNKKLEDSISEINIFEIELSKITGLTETEFADFDIDKLKALKQKLEDAKKESRSLQTKLQDFDIKKIVEKSDIWTNYTKDLESELNQLKELNPNVAENNEAVKTLFGYAKKSKKQDGLRGRVILSDIYLDKNKDKVQEKIFDHIAIDRFTGGGINGALYQEKAVQSNSFKLDIFIEKQAFENKNIKIAFKKSLDDLVNGNIQLGGNTGKGHGVFIGSYELKND